jgi:hypothetical protein
LQKKYKIDEKIVTSEQSLGAAVSRAYATRGKYPATCSIEANTQCKALTRKWPLTWTLYEPAYHLLAEMYGYISGYVLEPND